MARALAHGFPPGKPSIAALQADLLKVSDADLEWLLGMDMRTALDNPCKVSSCVSYGSAGVKAGRQV